VKPAKIFLKTLRQKGNLAYEYHPFRNYQTSVDLCKIDDFIIPKGYAVIPKNGELLYPNNNEWIDKRGRKFNSNDVKCYNSNNLYAKAGSLIELNTQ
jgi:hypothetical protein